MVDAELDELLDIIVEHIDDGKVIPIIGEDLIRIEHDGRPVSLYPYLTPVPTCSSPSCHCKVSPQLLNSLAIVSIFIAGWQLTGCEFPRQALDFGKPRV